MAVWRLVPGAMVRVRIFATGALPGMAHDRSLVAPLAAFAAELPPPSTTALDVPLTAAVDAVALVPEGDDLHALERSKFMRELRGAKVLAAERYPQIRYSGRYIGTWQAGRVSGVLELRGRELALDFQAKLELSNGASLLRACAYSDGRLSDLGIKPFTALLGALRLADRVVLEVQAAWAA